MKLLFICLILFVQCLVISQEIEHNHSIHHAFIENKGQWDDKILFKSHFKGGNLWIEQGKFMFHLQDFSALQKAHTSSKPVPDSDKYMQDVIHLNFKGSHKVTEILKFNPTKAYYNYFIGNDKEKWTKEVRGYSEAILQQLYTGIDLKIIEQEAELKYEFHVAPKVTPSQIVLDFAGQKKIAISKQGELLIETKLGTIRENKPYAYQIINGKLIQVACDFEINGNEVRFKLGKYNSDVALVIDPELVFATYSGAITDNFGMTATYGYDGTAYSGGILYGNSYPTPDPNAYDVTSNFTVVQVSNSITTDVFVSKYSSDGTTMLWTTFIGGGNDTQGTETVHSMICDQNNNIFIYGSTSSTDFPIVGGFQSTHAGGSNLLINSNGANFGNSGIDIFVSRISSDGHNLLASTYMGGSNNDGVNYNVFGGNYGVNQYDSLTTNYGDQFRGEIMLDQNNNCLIASCTRSTNFPTQNAVQPTIGGMQDGIVFMLNENLSSLLFSTYIGGSNNDACYSVKIDSSFNIVFAGGTSSSNLQQTTGAWQPNYMGGKVDGFVGKLNQTGTVLQRITYVGTSNYDQVFFVEIDRDDNVYLLGQSRGGTFPVINATFSNPNSTQFIAKLNPDLSAVLNSTVFGNGNTTNLNISPAAFLVDNCGNIYVCGWGANILLNTMLSGMPVTPDAYQGTSPNGFDFYLMVMNRTFSDLIYGTYLGGNQAREHVDGGTSRFDKNGIVYQSVCGGCGGIPSDFPTSPNAWSDQNLSSNCNNVVFKFDFGITPNAEFTVDQTSGCAAFEVTFDNTSTEDDSYLWDFGNGNLDSTTFNPTIIYTEPGVYEVSLFVTDSICQVTDVAQITIEVLDSLIVDAGADIELCAPVSITLTGNSFGTSDSFIWSTNNTFNDQLNTTLSDSVLTITPSGSAVYYFQGSNAFCNDYDSVLVTFTSSSLELNGETSICAGDQTTISLSNNNPSINFTYQWAPASSIIGSSSETSVVVSPAVTGYIYITASASNGCLVEDSILINVSNLGNTSVVASSSDYYVVQGTTVTLTGEPGGSGYTVVWTPSNAVTNPTVSQTSAVIEESTLFTYTVSDGFCTKSDTVFVQKIELACEEPFIYIPNAFTPNDDNENDVLFVRGPVVEEMLFRVFNRWGELVFESTSRSVGWDGTFKGRPCDPDVYDYYLEGICVGGEEALIKGNVTLIR